MSASVGVKERQEATGSSNKGINIALWVVQVLLALAFGAAGLMKLSPQMDPKNLGGMSLGLVRFIGIAELAGALVCGPPGLERRSAHPAGCGVGNGRAGLGEAAG